MSEWKIFNNDIIYIITQMNQSTSTLTGKTKIKMVLIGDLSVGKTSIISKYIKDTFDETSNPTIGIDFLIKNTTYKRKKYRMQLWDTAGQERFRSLIPNYMKDAKCAIIVIDVGNKSSLNSVSMWQQLFNSNKRTNQFTFCLLVGNKIDLQYRQISQKEALKKAEQLKMPYFEVSAKTGENIEELFDRVIEGFETRQIHPAFQSNELEEVIAEIREEESEIKNEVSSKIDEKLVEEVEKVSEVADNFVLKEEKSKQSGKKKKQSCC